MSCGSHLGGSFSGYKSVRMPGKGAVRGSGLTLLLGYLRDCISLQREVREISGHERRVYQEQDSWGCGQGFQWKSRHEIDAEA